MATKKPAAKKAVAKKNAAIVKKSGMSTAKKKLGNAKPKPATKKVAAGAKDHWFAKLSKKAQAEYIKTHPNSKFAKGAKVKAVTAAVKKKPKLTITDMQDIHQKHLNHQYKTDNKLKKHTAALATLETRHKNAKSPEAKAKVKLKIKATKDTIKSVKKQLTAAKATSKRASTQLQKHGKKLAGKPVQTVPRSPKKKIVAVKVSAKKPAAKKTATLKAKKPAAKKVVLKSGKISVRRDGPHSAKTAKASQIRERRRAEKLKTKR